MAFVPPAGFVAANYPPINTSTDQWLCLLLFATTGIMANYYTKAEADALFLNKNGTLDSIGIQDFQAGIKTNTIDESDNALPSNFKNSAQDLTIQSGADLLLSSVGNTGVQADAGVDILTANGDINETTLSGDKFENISGSINETAGTEVNVNAEDDITIGSGAGDFVAGTLGGNVIISADQNVSMDAVNGDLSLESAGNSERIAGVDIADNAGNEWSAQGATGAPVDSAPDKLVRT